MQKLTSAERAVMRDSFLDADPEQLKEAQFLATLLSDGEANRDDAILALTFHYSQKENLDEMRQMFSDLMLEN